jgi:predicted alpha/beta-hydrolase family hydrolase
MSEAATWTIAVGEATTTAAYEPSSSGEEAAVFVLAHGAGGNMSDRSVLATAKALRERGIGVVRFNFLYKEKKSGRPDPMPRLRSTFAAVVAHVRAELRTTRLIIGGRSMGGRAASMLAADGFGADGLLLFAYPLHPPGQPEKLRTEHLPRIRMPVLAFSGTRDPFCTVALMERAVGSVTAPWEMVWVEGADHSFHVLKSSGRTDGEVMGEMADRAALWASGLGRHR